MYIYHKGKLRLFQMSLHHSDCTQGGKQYFDSGDYMMHSSQKDRQEIASHPHAMNPHLAQRRAKAVISRSQPSKLTSNSPPKLSSAAPRKSPLAQ